MTAKLQKTVSHKHNNMKNSNQTNKPTCYWATRMNEAEGKNREGKLLFKTEEHQIKNTSLSH